MHTNTGVRGKTAKFPLPEQFAVSDRVRAWAQKKGFSKLDEHLENFRLTAQAKGYAYADWDSALMKAISADWAKLRVNGHDSETLADLLGKDRP